MAFDQKQMVSMCQAIPGPEWVQPPCSKFSVATDFSTCPGMAQEVVQEARYLPCISMAQLQIPVPHYGPPKHHHASQNQEWDLSTPGYGSN